MRKWTSNSVSWRCSIALKTPASLSFGDGAAGDGPLNLMLAGSGVPAAEPVDSMVSAEEHDPNSARCAASVCESR
jgi:hypothetical protein